LCRDWHRSDDLVQSALAKLYTNWHRVDQSASPAGYARTVLVNTFLSKERGRRWKRVVLVRDPGDGASAPEHGGILAHFNSITWLGMASSAWTTHVIG
jgi:DNA-directed RNA polymerase specialized sigma24 family protein